MVNESRSVPRRVFLGTSAVAAAALGTATAAGGIARAAARSAGTHGITVASGQTYVVSQVTRTNYVKIASGGVLTAPSGYSLTMTVNGVETGQVLAATGGADTVFAAGEYRGDIVLTPATSNDVAWQGLDFPIRQALFVGSGGVTSAKSVLSAVNGGKISGTRADGVRIASAGACFDGLYVSGGAFTLANSRIDLAGAGRCDFVGYGAAVVGDGTSTRLVLDGVSIQNKGIVRTGVIATNGSTVVVKNSEILCQSGPYPSGYEETVDLEYMESCPWMLGIKGDVRATNLLGDSSTAAYINSSIVSQDWGVLSTDSGSDCRLLAVNSYIANTGSTGGYGSYIIGGAVEHFLGCRFDVGSYAAINTGGSAYYGDSTRDAVASYNSSLDLGLTDAEIRSLRPRNTVIDSRRWGFMWHAAGEIGIGGGTVVNSELATFLNKNQQISVTVDGSGGARLNPANGIILQLIENDDPGPVMVDGNLVDQGVYTCPTGIPSRYSDFDVTSAHSTDSVCGFSDIELCGDFYNGVRGGSAADPGINMVLDFDHSNITGVISATLAYHYVSEITTDDYLQLGVVSNEAYEVINNGVIVSLASGSSWTVSGTSYLSKLVIDSSSVVKPPPGKSLTLTVNGSAATLTPGTTYTGALTLTVS